MYHVFEVIKNGKQNEDFVLKKFIQVDNKCNLYDVYQIAMEGAGYTLTPGILPVNILRVVTSHGSAEKIINMYPDLEQQLKTNSLMREVIYTPQPDIDSQILKPLIIGIVGSRRYDDALNAYDNLKKQQLLFKSAARRLPANEIFNKLMANVDNDIEDLKGVLQDMRPQISQNTIETLGNLERVERMMKRKAQLNDPIAELREINSMAGKKNKGKDK